MDPETKDEILAQLQSTGVLLLNSAFHSVTKAIKKSCRGNNKKEGIKKIKNKGNQDCSKKEWSHIPSIAA